MSRIDDELAARFGSIGDPPPADDAVSRIGARRGGLSSRRRVGAVVLTCTVLLGTVVGYATLSRAFLGGSEQPGDETVGPSPGASPTVVADTACTTHEVTGHFFDEEGGLDTARLTCDQRRWELAFEWASGASGVNGTACMYDCRFWAVSDLDGDGTDELVMWSSWKDVMSGGEWYPLGYLFILDSYPSESAWQPLSFEDGQPRGDPSVGGVAVLPIGGGETRIAALSCTVPELTWSVSHARGDGTWLAHTIRFEVIAGQEDVDGDRLRSISDVEVDTAESIGQPAELRGTPILGPHDEREPTSIEPLTLPGLDEPVCRVERIPGAFGQAGDEVIVFEELQGDFTDCAGEGFQHLAVARDGEVVAVTDRLIENINDHPGAWPFATPDIDGDGVAEIAIGNQLRGPDGDGDYSMVSFLLWRVREGTLEPIAFDCGATCMLFPWITLGQEGDTHFGAVCDTFGGRRGMLRWEVVDGSGELRGNLWVLDGSTLRVTEITEHRTGEASASLPDGMIELCGSPTHWPNEFDSQVRP